MKTVYIDYSALSTLALSPSMSDERYQTWQSMQDLWKAFKSGDVRLVTSKQDVEKDIILRLNGQGCCITDVLRAMEAIEEFERWEIADKERTKQWKRILFFCEQVGTLPQTFDELSERGTEREGVLAFLADRILSRVGETDCPNDDQEAYRILHACLKDLHAWYTDAQWEDLKRTDYQRNWEILCSIISGHHAEPALKVYGGAGNLCLFGLLNRVVGLCKKSCRKLPVGSNHMDFIVRTVLQKYGFRERERSALHIYHCVRQGLSLFLTTNHNLIEGFAEMKDLLAGYPGFPLAGLRIVSPLEMRSQI